MSGLAIPFRRPSFLDRPTHGAPALDSDAAMARERTASLAEQRRIAVAAHERAASTSRTSDAARVLRAGALRALAQGTANTTQEMAADLAQHIQSLLVGVPVPPEIHLTRTSCAGFLVKQGAIVKSWRSRYFVVDLLVGTLTYYVNSDRTDVKGIIALSTITGAVADSSSQGMAEARLLIKTTSRTYIARAPSPQVRDVWIRVFNTIAPQ
eukprot:m.152060 g.152060  ORF g.152060 m.152060 type:complete len:210 (-) comp10159_c3_seq3:137-766(-)